MAMFIPKSRFRCNNNPIYCVKLDVFGKNAKIGEQGNFVELPRIFELIRFNVVAKKYVHRIWLLWNAYIIII